ncbi:hypothetical protein V8J82_02335 [Gymnodinialimonas sp. 2305UL16-5]
MSDAFLDLMFWIVVMVGLFIALRYLQKRRKRGADDTHDRND